MTLTVRRVGDLVSRVEIAEMLGVSKQRLHQILEDGSFPEPIATLGIGQVWDREAVRQWARDTGRGPLDDEDN